MTERKSRSAEISSARESQGNIRYRREDLAYKTLGNERAKVGEFKDKRRGAETAEVKPQRAESA